MNFGTLGKLTRPTLSAAGCGPAGPGAGPVGLRGTAGISQTCFHLPRFFISIRRDGPWFFRFTFQNILTSLICF